MQKSENFLQGLLRKKWFFLLLVAAELVFLGVRFAADYRTAPPITLDRSWFWSCCDGAELVDEGVRYTHTGDALQRDQFFAATDSFDLPKGSYRLVINYRNAGTVTLVDFVSEGIDEVPGLTSDDIRMLASDTHVERLLSLDYDCTGSRALSLRFVVSAGCGEGTSSQIEAVQIIPTHSRAYSRLFAALALFALLDFWLMVLGGILPNPWSDPKKAAGALILAGTVLLACLPLGLPYLTFGHDLSVHLSRIDFLAQTLMQGQFPARLYVGAAAGKGYPFGIMYPDLFLYPAAMLRILGFSLDTAYKSYVIYITVMTALITRHCLRRIFRSETVALTGTVLYLLCYYRLSNLYVRAALGEYTAMAFLPLVVYGLWCLYTQPRDCKKSQPRCWLPLALGFTGLLQSHLLSALMAGLFTALVCLLLLRRTVTGSVFTGLVKAAGAALLWNLWSLVPCVQYLLAKACDVSLNVPNATVFAESSAFLAQLFSLSGSTSGHSATSAAGFAADMPLTVGTVLGLAALLMLLVLVQPAARQKNPQLTRLGEFCLGLGALALFLSCDLFPWVSLSFLLPSVTAAFETIQYPWRFLAPASVLLVVAGCCALRLLPDTLEPAAESLRATVSRLMRMGLSAILMVMTVLPGANLMYSVCMDSIPLHYLSAASISEQISQIAGGEYLPTGIESYSDSESYWDVTGHAESAGIGVTDFSRGAASCTFTAQNAGNTDGTVLLPLFYYPGYRVTAGDSAVTVTRENGFVAAKLPAGWSGTATIGWQVPFYWHLFDFISLAGVIATVVLYRRRTQSRQNAAK